MNRLRIRIPLLAVLLLSVLIPSIANRTAEAEEPFRIVIVPDTQWNSQKWPCLTENTMKWIVANKDTQNIKFVLHVGDMVQLPFVQEEWNNFDKAITHLDGKVPYVLAVGNHDITMGIEGNNTDLFNEHFPISRFKKQGSLGGSFPEGTSDNTYHTFNAGGIDWLVISLIYNPTDEELNWAGQIAQKHPEHRVIVLTHCYLSGPRRNSIGENIWRKFASKHENIAMVFCGHVIDVARLTSTGEKGNTVYQMLFDWQNDKQQDPNTYIAIVEIDPENQRIAVKSYSPTLDKEITDDDCKFVLEDVEFLAP